MESNLALDQRHSTLIIWNDSYNIGIKEIDDQHKMLIHIANELFEKISLNKASDILEQVFNSLFEYIKYHFSTEERLMLACNYPDYIKHKNSHAQFVDVISELKKRFDIGEPAVATDALRFLRKWIFNHIKASDKYLAMFLQSNEHDRINAQLEIAYSEIERLNAILESAIPKPFLNRIAFQTPSTESLRLLEEEQLSILFCDIRSYTSHAERMTARETLKFLNSIFSLMEPSISEHEGFIDKFIGDAALVLFDRKESATHAIQTAIDIQFELVRYNQEREKTDLPEIQVGIGINTGPVVVGLLGTQTRVSSTVIGDHVNLSARLQELTKTLRSDLLISQATFDAVSPDRFLTREIATLRVRGKAEPVTIYEVFDFNTEEVKEKKLNTKALFEQGIALYKCQAFDDAEACFEQCLSLFPEDIIALEYLRRCHHFRQKPPNPDDTFWMNIHELFNRGLHKRFAERQQLELIATVYEVNTGIHCAGVIRDISVGGIRLEQDILMEPGAIVIVETMLQETALRSFFNQGAFKVLGQVRWKKRIHGESRQQGQWQVGIDFVTMDLETERQLHHILRCPVGENMLSCPVSPINHQHHST